MVNGPICGTSFQLSYRRAYPQVESRKMQCKMTLVPESRKLINTMQIGCIQDAGARILHICAPLTHTVDFTGITRGQQTLFLMHSLELGWP